MGTTDQFPQIANTAVNRYLETHTNSKPDPYRPALSAFSDSRRVYFKSIRAFFLLNGVDMGMGATTLGMQEKG